MDAPLKKLVRKQLQPTTAFRPESGQHLAVKALANTTEGINTKQNNFGAPFEKESSQTIVGSSRNEMSSKEEMIFVKVVTILGRTLRSVEYINGEVYRIHRRSRSKMKIVQLNRLNKILNRSQGIRYFLVGRKFTPFQICFRFGK